MQPTKQNPARQRQININRRQASDRRRACGRTNPSIDLVISRDACDGQPKVQRPTVGRYQRIRIT